jgi:thiamine-phosphate pyrophosphorylase
MKCDKASLLLYAVTDRSWLGARTLEGDVEKALSGGATFLQLREKNMDDEAFLAEALKIRTLADRFKVPFVINDNVEVAVRCGADGVHVGQSDMQAGKVRERIGPDKILGVSAATVEQALAAQAQGADYLGVGAVFSTSTKLAANTVAHETLAEICRAVSIPVVAIGGIGAQNVLKLSGTGIAGIAVVSAIFAQPDVCSAAREMLSLTRKMVRA